jgi:hypothetical protein
VRVRVTDIRDYSVREITLSPESGDMPGWQSGVIGWSIGRRGSGAPIEIDEPLDDCRVGVFSASFQVLLWGTAKNLPDVWLFPIGASTDALLPLEPERWLLVDREGLSRVAMGGDVRLRIDQSPIRFGNYILECLRDADLAKECCGACNAPLRMYFRVGSQQLCPACTERFKGETLESNARTFRRALRDGIVAAAAGGVIHSFLLNFAQITVGPVLTGLLVGFTMRIASRESAGTRYQWTAMILTLLAGALPMWVGFPLLGTRWDNGVSMSVAFLAFGMIGAWSVTARNVPTEIHGPFQARS